MTPALVVFARVPAAGAVKTRLTPYLSESDAARLYEAFLLDALDGWTAPGAFGERRPAVRLYAAPEGGPWPAGLAPGGVSVHDQRGVGLGARMMRAAVESFAAGHDRVVIVGTDHPTLPLTFIEEAFRALEERFTVVLGPCDDGGYYLIGLNEVIPALFDGLSYGHSRVLQEALERAVGAGAQPVLLPGWYDVDTPPALERLVAEMAAGAGVGRRTAATLDALFPASNQQPGTSRNDSGGTGADSTAPSRP